MHCWVALRSRFSSAFGLQADQLLRERWCPIDVFAVPPNVHPHVAAIDPTQARKGLRDKCTVASLGIATEDGRSRILFNQFGVADQ